ncbi:hypothetical protein E3N88_11064 [Mikania micrantha]|uniref:PWI domain-containing protein n=1 Tax=Mikania micrantha TaxID=192012 RepID=A0A5N6PCN9_9ASTR|nr:hypothetical protein E3N88_11064 [Mikania micrantha]
MTLQVKIELESSVIVNKVYDPPTIPLITSPSPSTAISPATPITKPTKRHLQSPVVMYICNDRLTEQMGTTADQDTRFSNKHAKLLKSFKFPPELENLVDMTKVKMDVMRPWIAQRVTELLGFEDEVLINFIYGLLEEKVVNGKEIQISLTGFMEKNTGKFMKELWSHLLSAQQNASGVPQQFLDAKEEETRKKLEDTDRITRELKRTKEKEGLDQEHERVKMDREAVDVKAANLETHSRRRTKFSSKWSADDNGMDETNGSKETASLSASPEDLRRSVSVGRRSRSLSRRFSTPRRVGSHPRSPSPARRRLRSTSPAPSCGQSPLPARRRLRSPARRRSPSPIWHRSRSPVRRRSPPLSRHRSRSPIYRRSQTPIRRRSRSPVRRRSRSPVRRWSRSPVRRWSQRRSRSPAQRRLRTPVRRRSPSPFLRRPRSPYRQRSQSSGSPYPVHSASSPIRGRSPSLMRRRYQRAPSTPRHQSPLPIKHRATVHKSQRSPSPGSRSSSPSGRISLSPTHGSMEKDLKGRSISHNGEPVLSHSPSSSVSPPSARISLSQERSLISPEGRRERMNVKDRLSRVEMDERNSSRFVFFLIIICRFLMNDDGKKNYPEFSRDGAHDSEKRYKTNDMNRAERRNQSGILNYGSDESDHKRKHKRPKRKVITSDDDTSHDSHTEDRKEAKRRRKEEKRLRKEEKYKRREERRHRKEIRRSEKLKQKAGKNDSDSHDESTLSDQKKLEIELREKALESLRAKRGGGH